MEGMGEPQPNPKKSQEFGNREDLTNTAYILRACKLPDVELRETKKELKGMYDFFFNRWSGAITSNL
jgi:hypothetical protein